MVSDIDLSKLPPPLIIEELDFEAILSGYKAKFSECWESIRAEHPELPLPAYDVSMLETDPPAIILEAESYRDLLLRQRINEAARDNLLAFSRLGGLDHLAGFYGVARMAGEDDARLKRRVILAIQGRSTGGTEPRYRLVAMSADIRVADAIVYTIGRSPVIHVAIFSTDPDGVADEGLIAAVDAALQAPAVRMVNDTIMVHGAVRTVIDIEADVWLLPDAPLSVLAAMETALRDAWDNAQALGRDFVTSWWTAQMMLAGVHHVEPLTPSAPILVPPDEAVSIGSVTLTYKGRAY